MKTHRLLLPALLLIAGTLPTPAADTPKKMLVVSITQGFRHSSVTTAEPVLAEIGKESGLFTVDYVRQPDNKPNLNKPKEPTKPAAFKDAKEEAAYKAAADKYKADLARFEAELPKLQAAQKTWNNAYEAALAKLTPETLKQYDILFFANTTGPVIPKGGPREAILEFVKSGKAFAGAHSATDTFGDFPGYVAMINGNFAGHPWGGGTLCTFTNHEPGHPATGMYPAEFQWRDEIYQYRSFDPSAVRVLLSLNMAKTNPKMPYHVPVSWVREYGAGRIFYTNLGHNDATWKDKTYQKHLLNGIRWALKLETGSAAPNPEVSALENAKSYLATAAAEAKRDAAPLIEKLIAKKGDGALLEQLNADAAEFHKLKDAPRAALAAKAFAALEK
jgi:type 1 glutamine amidotransferase